MGVSGRAGALSSRVYRPQCRTGSPCGATVAATFSSAADGGTGVAADRVGGTWLWTGERLWPKASDAAGESGRSSARGQTLRRYGLEALVLRHSRGKDYEKMTRTVGPNADVLSS